MSLSRYKTIPSNFHWELLSICLSLEGYSILVKSYRRAHQWNHWLTHYLGKEVLHAEEKALKVLCDNVFKNNVLLLGVPHQRTLFSFDSSHSFLLGPLLNRDKNISYIESEFYELPIQSGSLDVVILPHTLEIMDNPHKVLIEACRIVKPEGFIFILGFNPHSFWGLKKQLVNDKGVPWNNRFIDIKKIKQWLTLADFELEKQHTFFYRPPFDHRKWYQKFKFLEWIGNKCYKPFGGIYILKAKAKMIPLTPIRMRWTQELPGLSTSVTTFSTSFME